MIDTDDDDDITVKSAANEWSRRVKASVQHLIDLKRGAYSAKYTELRVCPHSDRILALPERRPCVGRPPKAGAIEQPLILRRKGSR